MYIKNKDCEYVTITISKDKYPKLYNQKVQELINDGCSQEFAEQHVEGMEIDLELCYSVNNGLFGIEVDALECLSSLYDPYDATQIQDYESQIENKTIAEINDIPDADIQREALLLLFSRNLMDNDEDNPFNCHIPVEQDEYMGGMSTNDLPCIKTIIQQNDGQIFFTFIGDRDEYHFDDLTNNELIQIAEHLNW